MRKVGPTCAKGRGISCSPTPRLCSVVWGGIGRRRQAAAAARSARAVSRTKAAPPPSPPPGSPQLQSNAHQGQDEDVNTRSLYRAQNFEDSPTKNAAVLLPLHSDLSGEILSKKQENTVLQIFCSYKAKLSCGRFEIFFHTSYHDFYRCISANSNLYPYSHEGCLVTLVIKHQNAR